MKPSITYREITVAIGILVAMVVALTLWMGLPGTEISATYVHPAYDLSGTAKTCVMKIMTERPP